MNDFCDFFDDITNPEHKLFREKEITLANMLISKLKASYANKDMVYIPNPVPKDKVEYIFITMEPSFGRWARSEENAIKMLKKGFKNFLWSHEDMVFNYAIYKYLSKSYYVTDISKIAMMVDNGNKLRKEIYPFWIKHLLEEIELFGKHTYKVFFVGNQVQMWLHNYIDKIHVAEKITHFSILAASKRNQIAKANKKLYQKFLTEEALDEGTILDFTRDLLEKSLCNSELVNDIFVRIASSNGFMNETRKKLIFSYYLAFNNYKI